MSEETRNEAAGDAEAMDLPVPDDVPEGHRSGFVALVGRANVGKSTLLNRLVGVKLAITSPVPQTTRHRILGVRTLPNGQIAFLDTPGFHRPHRQLGEVMLERAKEVLDEADVICWLIDAAAGPGPGDRWVLDQVDPKNRRQPVLFVPNKIDLANKGKLLPLIEQAVGEWGCVEAVPVSAATGENCDRLLEVMLSYLPEGPRLFPENFLTDQDEKLIIAEIIREKLLHELRQEVPYAVAVTVERLEEREDGLLEIGALVLVERDTHKGIVIGKGGSRLKKVGTYARRELEDRLGRKVFLELWVKVKPDWRDKTGVLRELGLY